jgi:hypothetical protein
MPCTNNAPYFLSNTYRCGNGKNEIHNKDECIGTGDFAEWRDDACILKNSTKFICKNSTIINAYGKYIHIQTEECTAFLRAKTYNTANEARKGLCVGTCSDNSDCLPGLKCFQKPNSNVLPVYIPGCNATSSRDSVCYKPSTLPGIDALRNKSRLNDTTESINMCEGTCNNDDECKDGLSCSFTTKDLNVPGCNGIITSNWSYCINKTYVEQPVCKLTFAARIENEPHALINIRQTFLCSTQLLKEIKLYYKMEVQQVLG